MSQVKVQGGASGSGVMTILAPNTSNSYTLTLPTQTGVFSTTAAKSVSFTATTNSNQLILSLSPVTLDFRSTTVTSGAVSQVESTSAVTLTVPASATLGTVNNVQSTIAVLAINNAGTIELAVVNVAGGTSLDETGLISTTAISSGSTSATTIYSTSARTSVAYRVVGMVVSTQATAGTWATTPTLVQPVFGQAYAALQSVGNGQTWQAVTRNSGTTYYNTTNKPICFLMSFATSAAGSETVTLTINGTAIGFIYGILVSGVVFGQNTAIIPPGASYSYSSPYGVSKNIYELR